MTRTLAPRKKGRVGERASIVNSARKTLTIGLADKLPQFFRALLFKACGQVGANAFCRQ
ncbi:MAG: hypothetical protein N2444_06325 [Methylocystis sp.]|nr:hypothetical protein [Methylocystis sp.]